MCRNGLIMFTEIVLNLCWGSTITILYIPIYGNIPWDVAAQSLLLLTSAKQKKNVEISIKFCN